MCDLTEIDPRLQTTVRSVRSGDYHARSNSSPDRSNDNTSNWRNRGDLQGSNNLCWRSQVAWSELRQRVYKGNSWFDMPDYRGVGVHLHKPGALPSKWNVCGRCFLPGKTQLHCGFRRRSKAYLSSCGWQQVDEIGYCRLYRLLGKMLRGLQQIVVHEQRHLRRREEPVQPQVRPGSYRRGAEASRSDADVSRLSEDLRSLRSDNHDDDRECRATAGQQLRRGLRRV